MKFKLNGENAFKAVTLLCLFWLCFSGALSPEMKDTIRGLVIEGASEMMTADEGSGGEAEDPPEEPESDPEPDSPDETLETDDGVEDPAVAASDVEESAGATEGSGDGGPP